MIEARFGKIFINPDYVFVKRSINAYPPFGQLYNPVTVDRMGSASRIDIAPAMRVRLEQYTTFEVLIQPTVSLHAKDRRY